MDKKELQNLIDRISLTGPEGIKKIKKVLKELSDGSSSGSMGEDEEYTIAQALNDLNERVEELSKSIKEQIVIDVLSFTDNQSESEEDVLSRLSINGATPTKQQIKEALEGLQNVIVRSNASGYLTYYTIVGFAFYDDMGFTMYAGYDSRGLDTEDIICISINGDDNSFVSWSSY